MRSSPFANALTDGEARGTFNQITLSGDDALGIVQQHFIQPEGHHR